MLFSLLSAEYLVHCRTGSLEMHRVLGTLCNPVHCRTGSLEILKVLRFFRILVHCRTGSLEMQ